MRGERIKFLLIISLAILLVVPLATAHTGKESPPVTIKEENKFLSKIKLFFNSFRALITGHVTTGDSCLTNEECDTGNCGGSLDNGWKICCAAGDTCCTTFSDCDGNEYCDEYEGGGYTFACQPDKASGESCVDDTECAGTCVDLYYSDDSVCIYPGDTWCGDEGHALCGDIYPSTGGYCGLDEICYPRKDVGESCTYSTECTYPIQCTNSICGGVGGPCSEDSHCESGNCDKTMRWPDWYCAEAGSRC